MTLQARSLILLGMERQTLIAAYNSILAELPTLPVLVAWELAKAKVAPMKKNKLGYAVRGEGQILRRERSWRGRGY